MSNNIIYTKRLISDDPVINKGTPIWERLFNVRIQQKFLQTDSDLKLFGMISTGDQYYDNALHNQLVDVMLTINSMVEYYRKGITVRISKHEDTKIIFEIIKEYLEAWYYKLQNGINVAAAPMDDLTLLDQFAASIYPHAKLHFKIEDFMTKVQESFGFTSMLNRHTNVVLEQPKVNQEQPDNDKYESIAALIANRANRNTVNSDINKNTDSSSIKPRWAK